MPADYTPTQLIARLKAKEADPDYPLPEGIPDKYISSSDEARSLGFLLESILANPGTAPGGYTDTQARAANAAAITAAITTAGTNAASANKAATTITGLAAVATSGAYNDLSGKPTIPAAYTLPAATASALGGVKQGTGVAIAPDGTISATGGGGSSSTLSYVEVVGTPAICVKEIRLPAATRLTAVTLGYNAASVTFQVDTHTFGTRLFGTPGLSRAAADTALAALTDADYGLGVSLSAKITAANTFITRVGAGLSFSGTVAIGNTGNCETTVFPGQLAGGLLLNPGFDVPFTGDNATGWNSNLNYDATNKLAVSPDASERYTSQVVPGAMTRGKRFRILASIVDLPNGTPASGGIQLLGLIDYDPIITSGAGTFTIDFTLNLYAGAAFYLKTTGFIGAIKRFDIIPLS